MPVKNSGAGIFPWYRRTTSILPTDREQSPFLMKTTSSLLGTWCLFCVCIQQGVSPVEGVLLRTNLGTNWGTGMTRAGPTELLLLGTEFLSENATTPTDNQEDSDMDCLILIASAFGRWEAVRVESPSACMGGSTVFQYPDRAESQNRLGVVVGVDGNEAVLQTITDLDNTPVTGHAVVLGEGLLPVHMIPGHEESEVYVALHETHNLPYELFSETDAATRLERFVSYWQRLTEPRSMILPQNAPQIVKLNAETGVIDFRSVLEVRDEGSATLAALVLTDDNLIVVGSTNGSGDAFGTQNSERDGSSWDGYVTFLKLSNGRVDAGSKDGGLRIQSAAGTNDMAHGACVFGNELYIVGTREYNIVEGLLEMAPYLVAIDLERRKTAWTKVLPGINHEGARVICSSDGVFVGGHAPGGVDSGINVFVTALDHQAKGQPLWTVKLDATTFMESSTPLDNKIVDMIFNRLDGINVMFNAHNLDTGFNDAIFIDLDKTTGANSLADVIDHTQPTPAPVTPPTYDDTPPPREEDDKLSPIAIAAIIVPAVLALMVCGYTVGSEGRRQKQEIAAARAQARETDQELELQTMQQNGNHPVRVV